MARLVYGMNVSLDGFVDHTAFDPDPILFRHFIDQARRQVGGLYGRRLYEIMRYWDEDDAGWDEANRDFAVAWRAQHKWVVSRTLSEVGPNATLLAGDLETSVRDLKASVAGEIEVGGPVLAGSLGDLGLIDEYRLYVHPVVLGAGMPFFLNARPALRLKESERIGDGAIRLTYLPA